MNSETTAILIVVTILALLYFGTLFFQKELSSIFKKGD